jgi:signal transduction histidine kinase
MLSNNYDEYSDEERKQYIDNIIKISKNSYQLLENLLGWAQSQTGRIEYCPKIIDVSLLLREVIDLLSPMAGKKSIAIKNFMTESIEVYADSDMMRTVLRNLITNAIKFTNIEGVIKISQSETERNIKITIQDNGQGMDMETAKNLFKIDSYHKSIGTLNEKGTGFGLIICKEFVEKNGGNISVQSKEGKGSKFSFTIPKYS